MSICNRLNDSFHRYLNVPYTLNVHEFQTPKKPKATFVLIHGIGNTLHSWDNMVSKMPRDVRIIGIDLLGFGNSPKPGWAVYSAKTQARSVGVTLLSLRLTQKPIIVGHSLGALVAVEIAKRYPLVPSRLVLCSPPFYRPPSEAKKFASYDDMLRSIYTVAKKYPNQLERFSPLAVNLGFANKTLNISKDNVPSYLATLESSIMNQTSLQDVSKLKLPIDIFYGAFDPVVIKKHIINLANKRGNVNATRLAVGHEVVGGYGKSVANFLNEFTHKK